MCYERRRAEACVDESAHHALVNEVYFCWAGLRNTLGPPVDFQVDFLEITKAKLKSHRFLRNTVEIFEAACWSRKIEEDRKVREAERREGAGRWEREILAGLRAWCCSMGGARCAFLVERCQGTNESV